MCLLLRRTWHLKCSRKRSKDRRPPWGSSLEATAGDKESARAEATAEESPDQWGWRRKSHFPGVMLTLHLSVMLGHFPNSSFHPSGGWGERVRFAPEVRLRKITALPRKKKSLLSQRKEASPGQTELAAQSMSRKRLHLFQHLNVQGH